MQSGETPFFTAVIVDMDSRLWYAKYVGAVGGLPLFVREVHRMDKFLKAIRKWALKVKNIPLLGALAEDLATLLDMLRDCSQGIYRKLPRGLMIATVIALVYALSPIDLLPDLIPLAGFLDDAAILAILLEFCVAGDLLRYRAWRDPLRQKGLGALNDKLTAQVLEIIGDQNLAAAFLTEQK